MRSILLSVYTATITLTVVAQVPQAFNYQAIVRNENGTVKANETINLEVGIIADSINGTIVYLESYEVTTSALGLVNIKIGEGFTNQSFDSIDWADGPYFLEILVDGTNLGTSQLLSVPYALYANEADRVTSNLYDVGVIKLRLWGITIVGDTIDEVIEYQFGDANYPSYYFHMYNNVHLISLWATDETSNNIVYLDMHGYKDDLTTFDVDIVSILINKSYDDGSILHINRDFRGSWNVSEIDVDEFNTSSGTFRGGFTGYVNDNDYLNDSLYIECDFNVLLKRSLIYNRRPQGFQF